MKMLTHQMNKRALLKMNTFFCYLTGILGGGHPLYNLIPYNAYNMILKFIAMKHSAMIHNKIQEYNIVE